MKTFRRRQAHRARARKIEKFLSQPMFVAAQFTGLEGKYVKIEDTVRSSRSRRGKNTTMFRSRVLYGRHDEEALEKAEK